MNWIPWLLWAHIFGAILAFGPTYTFPLIGAMGGKEPMHANFATRISEAIASKFTWPLALLQGVTGVALIIASGRNLTQSTNYWLGVAIVLYVIALWFSHWVQTPRVHKVIAMTSTPPPPPAPGEAPSGPPPALLALIASIRQGGMILTGLVTVIVFLMVVKPGS
jgi:Predicted integral membrane protein (DUF2269)